MKTINVSVDQTKCFNNIAIIIIIIIIIIINQLLHHNLDLSAHHLAPIPHKFTIQRFNGRVWTWPYASHALLEYNNGNGQCCCFHDDFRLYLDEIELID